MKKKSIVVMLCIICTMLLMACGDNSAGDGINDTDVIVSSQYAKLEILENISSNKRILVDTDTGVLYLWYKDGAVYGQTLTPLYNADGSLKNISDFE